MPAQAELFLALPGGVAIGVTSTGELPLSQREQLLLGAYLPDAAVETEITGSPNIVIEHTESATPQVRTGDGIIELHDTWNGTFPDDLPHLLYSAARGLWHQRGYYPIHAACTGKEQFTLLPGPSGTGKSTTSLALVNDYDHKLMSGNTTLLGLDTAGCLEVIAGTKTMTLTAADFEAGDYETSQLVEYGNRVAFELSLDKQAQTPQAIGRIACIRLAHGIAEWRPLSPLSALHTLYPYMTDTEYQDCIVANGQALYSGETPPTTKAEVLTTLRNTLDRAPTYKGIGDAAFITEKVASS